jgi:GntR family transcriptional regulator / MocR family aminotransferase
VLLTPAHQYATGVALRPDRRSLAVEWARATDGLSFEDDYDGEFRYDRQPVGALQDLDPDRVFQCGSASKSLAPGLRLAWMVLPEALVHEIVVAKGNVDWSSTLEQLTFAEVITSGGYDLHVRSIRLRYRRRRDQVVAALANELQRFAYPAWTLVCRRVLELPPRMEHSVVQGAARQGLTLSGLESFRCEVVGPGWEFPQRDKPATQDQLYSSHCASSLS